MRVRLAVTLAVLLPGVHPAVASGPSPAAISHVPIVRAAPLSFFSLPGGRGFAARLGSTGIAVGSGGTILIDTQGPALAATWTRIRPLGASTTARIHPLDRLRGVVNDLHGSNPRAWRTHLATYSALEIPNLYPGIDLLLDGRSGDFRYTWNARSGASLSRIRLRVEGPAAASVALGTMTRAGPSTARIIGHISISRPPPRFRTSLSGDPVVRFSTPLGGGETDGALGVAVDRSGDAYVTGTTASLDFPIRRPEQRTGNDSGDIFVAKFARDGSTLIYSTFIGGTGGDTGVGIAVDGSDSPVITGSSNSRDFPVYHAAQPANRSRCTVGGADLPCSDAVVTRLNRTGDGILYSTYLGGGGVDEGSAVAVDRAGNAYVTGRTDSDNFPTVQPLQRHRGGTLCPDATGRGIPCFDAFVAHLSPAGKFVYSSYLGGDGNDEGNGIALDEARHIYVVGTSDIDDIPLMRLGPTRGGEDAFVVALGSSGRRLRYGLYLSGKKDDIPLGVTAANGHLWISGLTNSRDFTAVGGLGIRGRGLDAFLARIDRGGRIGFCTRLGGSGDDEAFGVAVDGRGDAFVTGDTNSRDFPTARPLQPQNAGGSDAFLAEVDPTGRTLRESTYLGGSGDDYGQAIALDASGNAFVVGRTMSRNFPGVRAIQTSRGDDAFVTEVSSSPGG